MRSSHKKRIEAIEEQARAGKPIIAVVDVRDLLPDEAEQRIGAKRAELYHSGSSSALIILKHK